MKYREFINRILDKLNDKELRSTYFFLQGLTGYTGLEEENERQR